MNNMSIHEHLHAINAIAMDFYFYFYEEVFLFYHTANKIGQPVRFALLGTFLELLHKTIT